MMPVIIAAITPVIYMARITSDAWLGKKVEEKIANTARRALHIMKGVISPAIILSRYDSNVLVAKIAGTLQLKPIIRGIKAFPGR